MNEKSMIMREKKILPAKKDEVFELLKSFEILKEIAAPYMYFEPINNSENIIWKAGETFDFRVKFLNFIPSGIQKVKVIEFDKDSRIYTNEVNDSIPIWNHQIILKDLGDGTTEYSNTVEVYAGWKTVFVYIWAKIFYRHRQRKLKSILSKKIKN